MTIRHVLARAAAPFAATGLLLATAGTLQAQQQPAARNPRSASTAAQQPPTRVIVYKTPTCTCCGKWVEYMRAAGFQMEVHDMPDITQIKRASGVTANLESCHTSQVNGYVIEGHVPVETIRRMLRERPAIAGIAAPGMPGGSPGMGTGGGFDVVSFTTDGRTALYQRH